MLGTNSFLPYINFGRFQVYILLRKSVIVILPPPQHLISIIWKMAQIATIFKISLFMTCKYKFYLFNLWETSFWNGRNNWNLFISWKIKNMVFAQNLGLLRLQKIAEDWLSAKTVMIFGISTKNVKLRLVYTWNSKKVILLPLLLPRELSIFGQHNSWF